MTDAPIQSGSLLNRLNVTAVNDIGELVLRVTPVSTTSRAGSIRISVLSYVIDALAGIAVDTDPDAWTFTSDMSVRMRPVPAPLYAQGSSQSLRVGHRSATCEVRLFDDACEQVAYGALGFSRVARRPTDAQKIILDTETAKRLWGGVQPIDIPLPDAAGIRVVDGPAGVVELDLDPGLLNTAGALQGAMVALVAEVAAEEAASNRLGAPALICEIDLRYLHQARGGPVRTECEWLGDGPFAPMVVRLVDVPTGQLLTHVITRATPPPETP